jgi:hypothetical protein
MPVVGTRPRRRLVSQLYFEDEIDYHPDRPTLTGCFFNSDVVLEFSHAYWEQFQNRHINS